MPFPGIVGILLFNIVISVVAAIYKAYLKERLVKGILRVLFSIVTLVFLSGFSLLYLFFLKTIGFINWAQDIIVLTGLFTAFISTFLAFYSTEPEEIPFNGLLLLVVFEVILPVLVFFIYKGLKLLFIIIAFVFSLMKKIFWILVALIGGISWLLRFHSEEL